MSKLFCCEVECCRDCPNAEHVEYRRMLPTKFCNALDKEVEANEIDTECPLKDL